MSSRQARGPVTKQWTVPEEQHLGWSSSLYTYTTPTLIHTHSHMFRGAKHASPLILEEGVDLNVSLSAKYSQSLFLALWPVRSLCSDAAQCTGKLLQARLRAGSIDGHKHKCLEGC